MSHTFRTEVEHDGLAKTKYVFHCDSGIEDGEVEIVQLMQGEPEDRNGLKTVTWSAEAKFVLPKSELVAFVSHLVRSEKIERNETASVLEVLGL